MYAGITFDGLSNNKLGVGVGVGQGSGRAGDISLVSMSNVLCFFVFCFSDTIAEQDLSDLIVPPPQCEFVLFLFLTLAGSLRFLTNSKNCSKYFFQVTFHRSQLQVT